MVVSKAHAAHGLPTATVVEGDDIATVHAAWDLPFAPTVMTTTESIYAHESQVSMTDAVPYSRAMLELWTGEPAVNLEPPPV